MPVGGSCDSPPETGYGTCRTGYSFCADYGHRCLATSEVCEACPAPTPAPTTSLPPTTSFADGNAATCASRERTWATLLFDALDADGDGTLTETELWAAGLDASGLDAATYAPCDDSSSRRRLGSEGEDSLTSAPDSLGSPAHNFVVEESGRGHRRLDDAPITVTPTPAPTFAPTRR